MFVSERVGCIKRKSIIKKKTKIKAKQKQNLIKINILNDVYSKKKKKDCRRKASFSSKYLLQKYLYNKSKSKKKKTISK